MADIKSVIDAFEKGLREKIFDRQCVLLLVKDVANAVELLKEYAVIKESISDGIHETAKMFRREG